MPDYKRSLVILFSLKLIFYVSNSQIMCYSFQCKRQQKNNKTKHWANQSGSQTLKYCLGHVERGI